MQMQLKSLIETAGFWLNHQIRPAILPGNVFLFSLSHHLSQFDGNQECQYRRSPAVGSI